MARGIVRLRPGWKCKSGDFALEWAPMCAAFGVAMGVASRRVPIGNEVHVGPRVGGRPGCEVEERATVLFRAMRAGGVGPSLKPDGRLRGDAWRHGGMRKPPFLVGDGT